MTSKAHHQTSGNNNAMRNGAGARGSASSTNSASNSGNGETLKEKVVQGFEHGKEALTELKDDMTDKLGTQLDAAKDTVRDASTQAGHMLQGAGDTVVTLVKENPLPLALTGVGITWLAVSLLTKSDGSTARSSSGSTSSNMKLSSIEQLAKDNPLMTAAAVFAAGTALGLAIPRSKLENAMLGHARDAVVDKAKKLAHETIEKVETVANVVTGNGSGDSASQISH